MRSYDRIRPLWFKVVLLGSSSVGKSSLFNRCDDGISSRFKVIPSTEEDCNTIEVSLDNGITMTLQIWDTMYMERFLRSDVSSYFRGRHVAIVVYDITQRYSFEKAKEIVDILAQLAKPGDFVTLVGNKADFQSGREVSFEEARDYADGINIIEIVIEVSAKSAKNVEDLFSKVVTHLKASVLFEFGHTLALAGKTLDLSDRNLHSIQINFTELVEMLFPLRHHPVSLAGIQVLNLSHNNFAELPDISLELMNLACLYVNDNRLSSLPESMKRLKRLRELDLRNNQLKGLGVIRELPELKNLFVEGNPLKLEEIRSLVKHIDKTKRTISIDIAATTPSEILAQGPSARLVYEKALTDGFVNVYRGRILLIGQDRAGKTSLKKTLLGLPFDFKEQSTDGIEIEPSKFEIEVERMKNWTPTCAEKSNVTEFSEYMPKILASERYHCILGNAKENPGKKLEWAKPQKEADEGSVATVEKERTRAIQIDNGRGNETENPEKNSEWVQPQKEAESESIREVNTERPLSIQISEEKEKEEEKEYAKSGHTPGPSIETQQIQKANDSDGRTNPSTESEMTLNATTLLADVRKHADQLLKSMLLKGINAEKESSKGESMITIDFWDFAGQHLYYAAHPVFFSPRAVYILVHNLNKPLNARAQPCVRQGTHEVTLENPNDETNLENLLSWLVTVHNLRPTREERVETSNLLPYLRPPVFIVGTHADKPYEDIKDVTSKIQRDISGKEYGEHVIRPFFFIDNTQGHQSLAWKIRRFFTLQKNRQEGRKGDNDETSAEGIHALRARILEVLRQEPYMGEKIPVRWFNFEKVIEALVDGNIYHTNTAHLQTYAKDVCFIEDDEQFHTMLNFYHDLGIIVKHRNTVILRAQWLISLFKKLITIPPFKKTDPVHSKFWLELERSGVLKMELVDRVFSSLIQQGVNKEDILDLMEQFGLIAKYSPSPAHVQYFVPCQLRSSPKELCDMEPSPADPCPLYLHFQEGFVPHGLFTRLVSKSVSWCCANGSSQEPKLYQNGAWFVLEGSVIHDMILICKKKFIKILLRQRIKDEAVPLSHSASAEVARSVRLFIRKDLEKMSEEFPYLRRLQHQFCVECPYCQQGGRQCTNHNQVSCAEDDYLHLLELKQGQDLICMESMSNKVLTVPGQEKWFLNEVLAPLVINTSQGGPIGSRPTNSNKGLRVTLLANEWNSSMGGLSTINRQLAILLAKRSELEVTLLVPQSACSEEEKRAAQSHKIVVKEAERRPGFDPLDWLSFPPKDLIIDVVVGHGAKLGKQAQIIRESHCCQWVQVVHTAPEELGMFKNYPRAIARGEEKTTAEVDLCRLANLVVAVGPKLTEAYSAYLRSCEKQQDIMSFTPGTFNEFSTLRQASVDSEKFRVLTFGRGDPEDFDLKGYDIAAKAVVELRDNSYHLIFVGAPDGKQEAVMENLLQSGIFRRQLTVRKFLQSKEKLKECFCEVDLCIMPSRTEGFGLTALEALSAGLPILVSGNSGLGDALRTVPSGKSFVVDSEDPKVWAEAIAGVRKIKRSQRLHVIERLRAAYEEHFSWEKQCDLVLDKMWHKVYDAGLLERIIKNLQRMQICTSKVDSNTNLTEELTTIVSDKGFRISDNQGSGNCMFHALSEQLETVNGIKTQHGQLRRSLVQYLKENPKLPDGTDLSHFVHGHKTWADYLAYVEQDGAWGDHLILCAAANFFKTCIHVVSSLHNDVVVRPHCPVDESKPLVLGHIHEVHYVSLQPI
ncbi:uncharacterized protein LOC111346088 isoform X2 [Stylophora pistillata]|uniref:uncharacterized protein LOC111346088 isoform X2 n=1 Tax=Stylophora pistillata TaxID=50429 RepID=UPI000C047DD2|nr:uncharacterized protein LOC111346088 isoform X2 [Stylophora pistillata]